jgi:iron complex transport system substrate-binding protein
MRRCILALALAALALPACGGDDDESSPTDAAAKGAGFPVTIRHAMGATTIERRPERVVALGISAGAADTALALGVVPVGMAKNPNHPSGEWPWLAGRLAGKDLTMLTTTEGVNYEQVAELRPDLILATGDPRIQRSYKRLSQIAPTVIYQTGTWYDQTWQQETRLVGRALGREAAAQRLVAATERRLAGVRRSHPRLAGKAFTFSSAFAPGQIVTLRSPTEIAVRLLGEATGMRLSPKVRKTRQFSADNLGGQVSTENVDLLDADVLMITYVNPQLRRATEHNDLFRSLDAVRGRRYFAIDLPTVAQLRAPSVLGIPWALQRLEPVLRKASAEV